MSAVICKFSGITLQSIPGFTGKVFLSHHPFLDSPPQEIFSLIKDLERHYVSLSRLERRLIFLALLKNSGLVNFASPATPSDSIILTHFDDLAWFCQELESLKAHKETFPKLLISRESSNLENFASIFEAWHSCLQLNYKPLPKVFEVGKEKKKLFSHEERKAPTKEQFNWVLANLDLENPIHYSYATKLKHPSSMEPKELKAFIGVLMDKLPTTAQPQEKNKIKIIQWLSSHLKTIEVLNMAELRFGFQVLEEGNERNENDKPKRENFNSFLSFNQALIAWEKGE